VQPRRAVVLVEPRARITCKQGSVRLRALVPSGRVASRALQADRAISDQGKTMTSFSIGVLAGTHPEGNSTGAPGTPGRVT